MQQRLEKEEKKVKKVKGIVVDRTKKLKTEQAELKKDREKWKNNVRELEKVFKNIQFFLNINFQRLIQQI